jgi:hypothetical protein
VSALVLLMVLHQGPEPPIVGRPAQWPFSGASARFVRSGDEYLCPFAVSASVSQARLEARQEFVMRLDIAARGPVLRPPERINLREVLAFEKSFYIAREPATVEKPGPGKWVWAWRLRPRGPWVREVPGFPFLFFNPDIRPEEKGYQMLWTAPLPLTVAEDEPIRPTPPGPVELVEPVGAEALRYRAWLKPGWGAAVLALVLPPAACVVWYLVWWWMYPDAARLALLRRNRAAGRALAVLDRLPSSPDAERAEGMVQALTGYLTERFGLSIASPTPEEAAAIVPAGAAERMEALWRQADAARFAGAGCPDVGEARRLIADLEELTCPPSS